MNNDSSEFHINILHHQLPFIEVREQILKSLLFQSISLCKIPSISSLSLPHAPLLHEKAIKMSNSDDEKVEEVNGHSFQKVKQRLKDRTKVTHKFLFCSFKFLLKFNEFSVI